MAMKINSTGPSSPIKILAHSGDATPSLPPAILCGVSAGASLVYNIEISDAAPGPYANDPNWLTADWFPFDASVGLTTSVNQTLAAKIAAVRVNVTSYTSGTLSFAVVQ